MPKIGNGLTPGTPLSGHGCVSLKWGVGVVTRTETQQLRQNVEMKLINLGNRLYRVQSGVCVTKFGHRLRYSFPFVLGLIMCEGAGTHNCYAALLYASK